MSQLTMAQDALDLWKESGCRCDEVVVEVFPMWSDSPNVHIGEAVHCARGLHEADCPIENARDDVTLAIVLDEDWPG